MWKLNNKAPDYLKKLCIPSSENHSRNLRSGSNNNLSVIRPKTNVMKKTEVKNWKNIRIEKYNFTFLIKIFFFTFVNKNNLELIFLKI
jgi:hypothetical protein